MKISQQPNFQPITIVLESKEESVLLWKIIKYFDDRTMPTDLTNDERIFLKDLLSWFSKSEKFNWRNNWNDPRNESTIL